MVRQIWMNHGSERVIPRKHVPFRDVNEVHLNFWSQTPKKLKFKTFKRKWEKFKYL